MSTGKALADIMRYIHDAYVAQRGDSEQTSRKAKRDAFEYIERQYRFSPSKIRLYLNIHARFYTDFLAYEHLRLTDMQLLLGQDIGDDIVSAVIDMRQANPCMSTREVKDAIAKLRRGERPERHLPD
ncbi:hypothetical protein M3A49_35230 [Paraburkholderia sp. CNPSo 3076]|uniref:hypothetical protein n=1 Tax=Paraburkholderia sp. CNPSo 3076 TaxID=2940936 RepID=UPI00225B30B6|nr:hypothetical protein [Paraburkholderia sp. CNPSo 3076]MCX5544659.1 hypothetical protein [Paraburkholderia sp. CNPSo 3076]